MDVIHHAYAGYSFNEEQSIQLGVTQVPFSLLPYGAHSFWFSANYYLGFEDDEDAGIHWKYDDKTWRLDLASSAYLITHEAQPSLTVYMAEVAF
ncbi:hypothetical protein [Shewanella benthica]|uniref:Uncharacterized protein n=1 Tax=Shewanella benthica KT99 TaxID=314608 RepID=A9D283_9GAMM|nr:hypothetical protein [Shewanella benthica]EDQ01774.1 hypothetical protein KT99_04204 [Shewanella benthica KT99]